MRKIILNLAVSLDGYICDYKMFCDEYNLYFMEDVYEKASRYNIVAPFEVLDECFMVIEFKKDGLKGVSGVVKYAKEFFE